MKLNEVRKIAIRKQVRVRFQLGNGMECVIDEHGVSRVPALQAAPDFNLEDELAKADRFVVEPVVAENARQAGKSRSEVKSRQEIEALAASATGAAAAQHHDDE